MLDTLEIKTTIIKRNKKKTTTKPVHKLKVKGGCSWIHGDPRGEYAWCDEKAGADGIWCDRHRKIVYQPVQPRRV